MIRMRMSEAEALIGARRRGDDVVFGGCSSDSRTTARGALFLALRGPSFDGHAFVGDAVRRGAAGALVCDLPGRNLPVLQVDDTLEALGRLAAGWRARFTLPVVAITGSNGKTTVKEMVASTLRAGAHVLANRGNLNNEIGLPLTLLELAEDHAAAVLEMGANHAGEIARLAAIARPSVGLITQCAPAHLEGFGSLDRVAHAKGELLAGLAEDGVAVINAEDPYAELWRSLAGARRCITFGLDVEADVRARWHPTPAGTALSVDTPAGSFEVTLALPGRHNALNAAAAVAAALAAGASLAEARAGLAAMHPIAGRLEARDGRGGCRLIDDTYNANPGSFKAGLEVLAACPGPRWLVVGDMAELGPQAREYHRDVGALARSSGVDRLFATGELSRETASAFGERASYFERLEDLIEALRGHLPATGTVLVKGSRSMRMERVVNAFEAREESCC